MRIIIAISIFLIVFGLIGYYVYIRATQAFAGTFVTSKSILFIYIFLLASFLLGKIIEHYHIGFISNTLVRTGSIALGFFVYALFFVIFFDLIRLINFTIPFYPSFVTVDYQKSKFVIGIISVIAISIIFLTGYINALSPRVKTVDVSIHKSKDAFGTLNVVAVSDIHLSTVVNKGKTQKLIEAINKLKPDLVIIAGDIIDDNIKVVNYYQLLEYFKEINSKYGVYSCMGNHEYISNAYKDLDVFEKNGIHMLKDSTVIVEDKFYIIGRDDIQGKRISGKERKTLKELTTDIDFKLPVILLDHQPFGLDKTAEYPIDLQFSGHTHNGQIWPLNYITGLIFEEDWGYLKKKDTHFYVSAGFGTAVVPIRLGNHSEVVNIKITNKTP